MQESTKFCWQAKDQAELIPHYDIISEASLFLIQAYLRLYLLSEEEQYKNTCESLLNSLLTFTKKEILFGSFIECLLIQGLLKRADFDLMTANKLFCQAEILATELGFLTLVETARKEQEKLEKRIDKLRKAQIASPETYKKMQLQEVLNYIQKFQKSIDI